MNKLHLSLMSALFLLAVTTVQAQKVYRCGADGREYSQTPCKVGREVDVADPRSTDQQRAGQIAAERQARLASQLEAERHAREAAARGQGPAGIKPAAAPEPTKVAQAPYKKGPKKSKRAAKPDKSDGRRPSTWTAASPRP